MILLLIFLSIITLALLFPPEAKAIIILPAIILIPIAKLVAIIIGGLSIPVLGISTFLNKVSGKSIVKGILVGISIILIIAVLAAVVLKFLNPTRPLF